MRDKSSREMPKDDFDKYFQKLAEQGKLVKYPVWSYWRSRLDVPSDSRKGIPRGQPRPIAGRKFDVAATMILFPRGKSLREIAEFWGTSPSLVANWRTEERFRDLVSKLEEEFALFVLSRMHNVRLIQSLNDIFCFEPEHWSDRVLHIFSHNIARVIRQRTHEDDFFYLIKKSVPLDVNDVEHLNILSDKSVPTASVVDFELTPPAKKSEIMFAWQALLSVALQTIHSYPWYRRGPKPPKKRKKDLIVEKVTMIFALLLMIGKAKENPSEVGGLVNLARRQVEDLGELLGFEVKR